MPIFTESVTNPVLETNNTGADSAYFSADSDAGMKLSSESP